MKAVAALTAACALACAAVVAFGPDALAQGGCQPGDALVSISGYAYSPASVAVAPGATVCWTNNDSVSHTVSGTGFDSGYLSTGETYRRAFPTPGNVEYYCVVEGHHMIATVVVGAGQPPPPPPPGPPPPAPPPPPPPPASTAARQTVSGFRAQVARSGGARWLVARATVTRAAQARLQLLRRNRAVAATRKQVRPGRNVIRLRLPRSLQRGRYLARLTVGGAARPYTARIAIG